jgi:hypothetical protein
MRMAIFDTHDGKIAVPPMRVGLHKTKDGVILFEVGFETLAWDLKCSFKAAVKELDEAVNYEVPTAPSK